MPSLASHPFASIVPLLPVADHSVEVRANRWLPIFQSACIDPIHTAIFGTNQTIRLTRDRLLTHAYRLADQKVLEILLWGYPSNQRGIVGNLILQLPELTRRATTQTNDWYAYFDSFQSVPGVNISTITKLAYFHGLTFQHPATGTAHGALILDDRVISALGRWPEVAFPKLKRTTARTHYVAYLDMMEQAAASLGAEPDQLELFLFSLGRAF